MGSPSPQTVYQNQVRIKSETGRLAKCSSLPASKVQGKNGSTELSLFDCAYLVPFAY
ncbi:MAG TPA: hypothetical protein V6C84_10750 [Coleofasciculaceae cyanobacterium]